MGTFLSSQAYRSMIGPGCHIRRFFLAALFASNPSITNAQQAGISPIIKQMIDSVSSSRLEVSLRTLESGGGSYSRVDFTPGYDSAASYIKRTLGSFSSLTSVGFDTFFVSDATPPYNVRPLVNVTATLTGKKSPEKIILIGAHLDACAPKMPTWQQDWKTIRAPGADDNASGVAGILEIARIMGDTAYHFNNDYTVQFVAFGAEESIPAYPVWTYGSIHCAQEARRLNKHIVGMVCLDMIGYNDTFPYVAVVSDSQSAWIGVHFIATNDRYGIGMLMNTPPFPQHNYSDHASFWASGYNAILLIENYLPTVDGTYYKKNVFYHSSADSAGTLNFQLMKKVVQLTIASVAEWSNPSPTPVQLLAPTTVPMSLSLSQNFPNPFNPRTHLRFSISNLRFVSLKIVDMLGKEVATLVNGWRNPGSYTIEWNASALPSGVYFCTLTDGAFARTIKMHLLK